MAIFYNHIKGCGQNTTGQGVTGLADLAGTSGSKNSKTVEVWTWVKWADTLTYSKPGAETDTSGSADLQYVENNPFIYINNANGSQSGIQEDNSSSLGRVITSRSKGQAITPSFVFDNNLDIGGNLTLKDLSSQGFSYIGQKRDILIAKDSCLFFSANEDTSATNIRKSNIGQIYGTTYEGKYYLIISAQSKAGTYDQYIQYNAGQHQFTNGPIWCQQHLHVGNDDYTFPTDPAENGTIKADHKCEAKYFNATSDKRAKENITPTKFSALSVVKALPTYTFNYKSNPNQKVLGLIAQDAAAHDLDGFNMVDNIEATGEGSDMMQMKESKLVYVLWKAVQELSLEVESLKAEIASLK